MPDVRRSAYPTRNAAGASPRDRYATAFRRGGAWSARRFPKAVVLFAAASTPAAAESTWSHRGCRFCGSPTDLGPRLEVELARSLSGRIILVLLPASLSLAIDAFLVGPIEPPAEVLGTKKFPLCPRKSLQSPL